nr:NAD(P)H-dependent oxidoreductase [Rhodoferax sp.]
MKVLAISGSLRAASIHSGVLRTAARLAPPDIEVSLCIVVGELPLFNPDLESHRIADHSPAGRQPYGGGYGRDASHCPCDTGGAGGFVWCRGVGAGGWRPKGFFIPNLGF